MVEALGHPQDFTDRAKGLWEVLREHYDADSGLERAHLELLQRQLAVRYPRLADDYETYIEDLDQDPPVENLTDLLVTERTTDLARDMAVALVEGSYETFEALLSDYRSTEDIIHSGDTLVGTDLSDLLEVQESGNRIPLGPDRLNAAIRGGALRGHNVLLFGRPEVGKSALALGVLKAAGKAGYRVGLWENEDPLATTQLRAVQCICNATEAEVRVNAGRYRFILGDHGYYEKMFFRESPDGTIAEIDAWVEKNDLDVVVINQMVNLRTTAENRVLELSTIARGMRGIAKRRNCVVVGVAQAGESAAGRSQLRLEDLEWSNTGVQATLDLMIGIGADERLEQNGERWLSLCKNKLGGTHDNILLDFDKERSVMS